MSADLIIVDGMNVLWRAAHAMRALGYEDKNGWQETGAVYGFLEQVLAVANRNKQADVLIAWEGSREGRRTLMPEYKEHRDTPDERMMIMFESIKMQRAVLCGLLKLTSWGQIVAPGWEADDAMATAASAASRAGLDTLIVSNDSDMLQCLDDRVTQWRTAKKENNPLWTPARLRETYDVTPTQWAHVKALGGDASDGYKGAHGIGEKWACRMISEYGDLPHVITAARSGKVCGSASKAEAIIAAEEYLDQCLAVALVKRDAKTISTWSTPDAKRLADSFAGLRFHSLHSNTTIRRMT